MIEMAEDNAYSAYTVLDCFLCTSVHMAIIIFFAHYNAMLCTCMCNVSVDYHKNNNILSFFFLLNYSRLLFSNFNCSQNLCLTEFDQTKHKFNNDASVCNTHYYCLGR